MKREICVILFSLGGISQACKNILTFPVAIPPLDISIRLHNDLRRCRRRVSACPRYIRIIEVLHICERSWAQVFTCQKIIKREENRELVDTQSNRTISSKKIKKFRAIVRNILRIRYLLLN